MDIEALRAGYEIFGRYAVLLIEIVAAVIILIGTIEALIGGVSVAVRKAGGPESRAVWLRYTRWLVAGLTFQLAGDIIESSISPTWDEIGRLAAIALIRTALEFFLNKDVGEVRERVRAASEVSEAT